MFEKKISANQVHFKTFRCNNQNAFDKLMTQFCQNLGTDAVVINESTSAFYIPLSDLPQNLPDNVKNDYAKAPQTANYLDANHAEQPIQYVGTITYTK